jgi:hypothetical protein
MELETDGPIGVHVNAGFVPAHNPVTAKILSNVSFATLRFSTSRRVNRRSDGVIPD